MSFSLGKPAKYLRLAKSIPANLYPFRHFSITAYGIYKICSNKAIMLNLKVTSFVRDARTRYTYRSGIINYLNRSASKTRR
jgi:hypothetical protein